MRIVILCDRPTAPVRRLINATCREAETRGAEVVCLAFSARHGHSDAPPPNQRHRRGRDLWDVGSELGIPVEPLDPDANDPGELDRIVDAYGPDTLLSLISFTVLTETTLQRFVDAVNLHDASLPLHAGVRATDFSIYEGDERSGFAFHRMTPDLDAGPVLVSGSVPIEDDDRLSDVVGRKISSAVDSIPKLFDALERGDAGVAQAGDGSHHTMRDVRGLLYVDHPSDLSAAELHRRLRAFSTLWLTVGGRRYRCTQLSAARPFHLHRFSTQDGTKLAITRIAGRRPVDHHLRRVARFVRRQATRRRR